MTTPPRKTYQELGTQSTFVSTDIVASARGTEVLKTVTGTVLADGVGDILGLGTMATQDADAVAITGGTIDGTAITDGSINVPAITLAGGTAATSAPLIVATQTWNGADISFDAITLNITDTASALTSNFFKCSLGGNDRYIIRKSGETIIKNAAGTSIGGLKMAGNAGEMALTSLIDPSTGAPADVLRWYWEDSAHVGAPDTASAAVIRGMGGNRFSVESNSALTHIAATGRFEWEGLVSARLQWVGYEAGTSTGRTIDFNNSGQPGTRATPISASVADVADDCMTFGTLIGSTWTTYAKVTGAGVMHNTGMVATLAANTAALTATGYSLTGSDATAGISLTGTWNTTGNPSALDIAITNTASGATAYPIRVTVGGAEMLVVGKTGFLTATSYVRGAHLRIGSQDNKIYSAGAVGSGIVTFYNQAETGFDRIQFGGTSASFPALKRSTTSLQARLANDSAFTNIQGKLTTDTNYAAGDPTTTGYLVLYDAAGTAYKVPAVAL